MPRGQGRGMGGTRQYEGYNPTCRCPKCGNEFSHRANTPCSNMICPNCGVPLRGY